MIPNAPDIVLALLVAILADAILGDPRWLHRHLGHPIVWLGAVIAWADRRFNRESDSAPKRRFAGRLTALGLIAGAALLGWVVQRMLLSLPAGWLWLGLLLSTLIAGRDLRQHVSRVASALAAGDLAGARANVGDIVGRDVDALDEAGIGRAAVESLAENFSDGVTAPIFWGSIFGLPGVLAYKTLNTADSMIGHKSPRYLDFGRASAKLDDLANLVPARLSALVLVLAAWFLAGAQPKAAWRAVRRDASRHASPNAGWPESAMAGALGLAIAGPRRYDGALHDGSWMGEGGDPNVKEGDIRRAIALFDRAWAIVGALVAVLWFMNH